MAERLVVRSYRRVFQVDRRIYRVDRWVLPVPGGVPLRGMAYFAVALLAVVVAGRLPGVGDLICQLAAPLRYVVVPMAVALLGTQAAPDGRVAHRFAWDWLCLRMRTRRRSAGRTVPLEREAVRGTGSSRRPGMRAQQRCTAVASPGRRWSRSASRWRWRRVAEAVSIARRSADGEGGAEVTVGASESVEVRR